MESIILKLEALVASVLESGLIIIIAALLAGFVIKKWIPDTALQNKWIPTINVLLGAALGIAIPSCFVGVGVVTQAIYGAMCGLFSSFLYDKVLSHISGLFDKAEEISETKADLPEN